MNKKVFLIDNNNNKMKRLSTAWNRMSFIPMIDGFVLLLGVPAILFLLNESKVANIYVGGSSFLTYALIVGAYIAITIIFAVIDFNKFNSLNNTMIVKENNNITIVKCLKKSIKDPLIMINKENINVLPKPQNAGDIYNITIGSIFYNNSNSLLQNLLSLGIYVGGTIEMQKQLTENDIKTLAEININKILDERNNKYEYTDYKNCKLLKETRNYYEYVGEKNGVSSKFKIYKVYSNINLLNKGEN